MIVSIEGATLGFDDTGTGMPIVFLHAFPLNRTMWTPQVRRLADRARCIAIDLRGFGESSATPPFSMDRYADDVAALLDVLHVERAVIVGLSMGGYTALALWRRHRDRVQAFVLADTRATADTAEGRERRRALIATAEAEGSAAVTARQMAALVGRTTRERRPDVCDMIRGIMLAAPVPGIVGALEAMAARPDSTPTLATIDVPTLFVVGAEDAVTPTDEARSMQRAVRGARLAIVPDAGHLASLEQPNAFGDLLESFVVASLRDGSPAV